MLPPFQNFGVADDESDEIVALFYALAFIPGTYVPATAGPVPAVTGLYFTTSPLFTPFSFAIFSPDGQQMAGWRGDDSSRSLEATLFEGALRQGTPLHAWLLYPTASTPSIEWPGNDREAYQAARNRLSLFLYRQRIIASLQATFPIKPNFIASDESVTPPESQIWPDQAEVEQGMLAEMDRLEADSERAG